MSMCLKAEPSRRRFSLYLNFAECLFVFLNIVSECIHQKLCMLWRRNNAGMHFRFRDAGKNARKVDDKFCGRMRDDGEVGINSFRFFFV